MSSEHESNDSGEPTVLGFARKPIVIGAAVVGVILTVVLVVIITGGDNDQTGAVGSSTTISATTDPGRGDADPVGPEVPPIDGCRLLTEEEVEEALGLSHDAVQGFFVLSGGEGCSWQPDMGGGSADDLFVTVAPGDPNDFQEGAEREGVVGVPVADLGAAALWFGGQGRGVLSVIEATDIGYALMEIELATTAIDPPTMLEHAKVLLSNALGQLQGTTAGPVEAALCDLIADEEAEEILAPLREGRPAALGEIQTIGPSAPVDLTAPGDSSCKKLILTEIYVEAASAASSDFEAGASLDGVAGEPINGVGDGATWFPGVPVQDAFSSLHEVGVLAVRQDRAQFRIGLSLPDVKMTDQLETARRLASAALIRIVAGDAEVITIEHQPPDPSGESLVGNLLAKEEAGEWTRGEGLVATLQLVVGEAGSDEVLLRSELESYEPSGVVNLAHQYLDDNPDPEAAAELTRLLELIFPGDEQLEAMAGAGPPTAALPGFSWVETSADTETNCKKYFSGWEIPPGVDKCLKKRSSPKLDEYKVFGPAPPLPTAGWEDWHFDLAWEALEETVPRYKSLGQLPPVNIVMSMVDDPSALAVAAARYGSDRDRPCGITLFTSMQRLTDLDFKQVVAHELAHCLNGDTFIPQFVPGPLITWWNEGLADYLSNTVPLYAENNLEIRANLDKFDGVELGTGVLDRSYDNFIFFQQLFWVYGNRGIFDLISSLPAGGETRDKQEQALSNFPDMRFRYHEFVEKATDVEIEDTGGGVIPNAPNSDAITLVGPTVILDDPQPFGATRLALLVPDGLYACIEYDVSSEVRLSWREGRPGVASGRWSIQMPEDLSGEAVMVATTTRPNGELTINVTDVSDNPNCEDEEEGGDPDLGCLDICGISDYYRYPKALPEWVADMLPPLSDPVDISPGS